MVQTLDERQAVNRIEFTLPRPVLPLLNKTSRQHWAERSGKKVREDMQWRIVAAIGDASLMRTIDPAIVTIERRGTQVPDHDGMVGGAKLFMDCLTRMRLIVDDSPKHIELRHVFTKVRHRADECTRVIIEERE